MNIDKKLQNDLHGPVHYTIGVIWLFSKTPDTYSVDRVMNS